MQFLCRLAGVTFWVLASIYKQFCCSGFSGESKMDRIVHELEGNRKMANQIAQQVFSVEEKVILFVFNIRIYIISLFNYFYV